MSDNSLLSGIRFYTKPENAPDYVVCNGLIYKEELQKLLESMEDKVAFQVKVSQKGNLYATTNNYTSTNKSPKQQTKAEPKKATKKAVEEIDLPF